MFDQLVENGAAKQKKFCLHTEKTLKMPSNEEEYKAMRAKLMGDFGREVSLRLGANVGRWLLGLIVLARANLDCTL